ncbi:STAS domain-containing protein [Oceanobacillus halophilus]|uniref:STAS domain-containing protein n=1 Tax=Oceanobacillus halophilus TaxID=930130 RepID=A0A495ABY7_9BACI|nr:STAS domain-containing protein [Oceanobacillus halophilus]RKQ37517.1 STAS domain-containing protein [Oceanobacillus halophilus]
MKLSFNADNGVKQFLIENQWAFEDELLNEAINVKDKIEEIKLLGNINLLENAHKVVLYVVDNREAEVISFGKQEGIAWAKHNLTLAFKLEWIQAIRTTLWKFLYEYDKLSDKSINSKDFFMMTKETNRLMDEFFKGFFISYSNFKDELLETQRKLVENLSVPIIPISSKESILPLIGKMDELRANTMEEKVLLEIGEKGIQTLIMDLSGIARMDDEAVHLFTKLLDGISMMGCKTILTGIRPDVVKNIVNIDTSFKGKAEVRATLQQALKDYIISDK